MRADQSLELTKYLKAKQKNSDKLSRFGFTLLKNKHGYTPYDVVLLFTSFTSTLICRFFKVTGSKFLAKTHCFRRKDEKSATKSRCLSDMSLIEQINNVAKNRFNYTKLNLFDFNIISLQFL